MRGDPVDGPVGERGQATSEYVGVVLLVATILALAVVLSGSITTTAGLAKAVVNGLVCAIGITSGCGPGASESSLRLPPTKAAYGSEVADLLDRYAPDVFFEDDAFASLPVDFRECRDRTCADTIREGTVASTQTGLPATAFTHVVDCRRGAPPGFDCSGERAGRLYLQYWFYYPESLTHGLGRVGGFHRDDWESLQVRVDPDGTAMARASSHHGYNGRSGGIASIGSDTGWAPRLGWDTSLNALHVTAGSHAGSTQIGFGDSRAIRRDDLVLIPAEPIASSREISGTGFEVTPPWRKSVWSDPESTGT